MPCRSQSDARGVSLSCVLVATISFAMRADRETRSISRNSIGSPCTGSMTLPGSLDELDLAWSIATITASPALRGLKLPARGIDQIRVRDRELGEIEIRHGRFERLHDFGELRGTRDAHENRIHVLERADITERGGHLAHARGF